MSDFRKRFESMVAALRAQPRVEVYEVVIRPSATNTSLRDAEKIFGMPLPEDLRSFYMEHDGVFLEWGLREPVDPYQHTEPFGAPDPFGVAALDDAVFGEVVEANHLVTFFEELLDKITGNKPCRSRD